MRTMIEAKREIKNLQSNHEFNRDEKQDVSAFEQGRKK